MSLDARNRERIAFLRAEIKRHNKLYYDLNAPEISDAQYDVLLKELETLEDLYGIYNIDSPTAHVGGGIGRSFKKIAHSRPMISLSNAFSFDEVSDFYKRIEKICGGSVELTCEPKIDGVSFAAVYESGALQHAITRGDGEYGEDITENFTAVIGVPQYIGYQQKLEIRGEIYISKEDFLFINEIRRSKNEIEFANPRNAAAGSLRQLDSVVARSRRLRYFVWGGFIDDCKTQQDMLWQARDLGFDISNDLVLASTKEEIFAYYEKMYEKRADLPYDIDGLVYKVNEVKSQLLLGQSSKFPRWAVAHKFPPDLAKTKIEGILIQVGRTGALTPVAVLKPVNIGGVVVSRASLHNEDEIKRKQIKIGDTVVVKRAGDVIPQIVKVDVHLRTGQEIDFIYPSNCPVCGSEVERLTGEVVVRCKGGRGCAAQLLEYLCFFVSNDAFAIDGLGEKQLAEFLKVGLIEDPVDIFKIPKLDHDRLKLLEASAGWGEKSVNNLLQSINKAQTISLNKFIYALGIRYIGQVTAEIIARYFVSIENFIHNIVLFEGNGYEEIGNVDGIGPVVLNSMRNFFYIENNKKFVMQLMQYVKVNDFVMKISSDAPLYGKKVIFTGILKSMNRDQAENIVRELGGKIVSSVSSKTDFVVAGENAGSKLELAKKLGVNVISEQEWQLFLR